jgi:hypothetical protein
MAYKSYRNCFVATTGTLLSSGTTTDLAVGQIGVFDAKTWQAQTAPSYNVSPKLVIAQGTEDRSMLPDGAALGNETYKTPVINGKLIKSWVGKASQRPQNRIVTLGYDGVNASKTLTANPGQVYTFWIKLSGQPILNFFPDQRRYLVEEITITLPCASDCVDNCAATTDCNVVADAIINAINGRKVAGTMVNGRKTVGGQYLSKYVKATKLLNCGTPSGYTTTNYTNYNLTVLDAGTPDALASVQAQYPGLVITRINRIDAYSTYQFSQPAIASAPAAYQSLDSSIIPNCTSCPSGYTYNAALYIYTVTRTDAGNASALTTLKSNYSDTTAIRLAYQYGSSIYEVHKSTSTLSPVTAGDVVAFIDVQENTCSLTGPGLTTAWTNVGTCTKAQTYFQITLENPACGGTSLAVLQSIYGNGVTLVSNNTSDCTSVYQITGVSDNIACDTCDIQNYTFTAPAAFQGIRWTEVDGNIYGTNCVCGVKFESAYVARQSQECFFDAVPYESDPLFIEISERNPDINDYTQLCGHTWPVTLVQEVKYPSGNGRFVAEFERLSRSYFNDPWAADPAERDMKIWHFMTDLDQYYDEYVLNYDYETPDGSFARHKDEKFEYHFYFPETTGKQFEVAINSYLQSSPIQLPPVVL